MIMINGQKKIKWKEGMTVRDMLEEMGFDSPLITVTINGEHVLEDEFDEYKIPDQADVRAIHLHHGG